MILTLGSKNETLAMTVLKFPQFTPAAAKFWAEIPVHFKKEILANVYCSHCRGSVKIVNYSGSIKSDYLFLIGNCASCGHEVARLVEGS